jgi:membrane protein required for beta-lactamase induction
VTQPTWTNWHEAMRVVAHRPYLKRTLLVALIVGSVLFAINHLDEVLRGQASLTVWIKVLVTFFVPFVVSNIGILVATYQSPVSHRE